MGNILIDVLLGSVICLIIGNAVRIIIRNKKKGKCVSGCMGDCANCSANKPTSSRR